MSVSPADFGYLRALVEERTAIVLSNENDTLADVRLSPIACDAGFAGIAELVAALRKKPFDDTHRKVVEALMTTETSFFRDLHPFEALGSTVIPEIFAGRSAERTLSIWSAACSTGQEPYSIAMLLRENFPSLERGKVRIIATDLCSSVLDRAREGVYRQLEVNRGLPAALLVRHFSRSGPNWVISPEIRAMAEFRQLNLAMPWPELGPVDVVFLRNVLIYFGMETRRAIFERLRRVLRPGGFLFLGSAETPIHIDPSFERIDLPYACCYRFSP